MVDPSSEVPLHEMITLSRIHSDSDMFWIVGRDHRGKHLLSVEKRNEIEIDVATHLRLSVGCSPKAFTMRII